MIANSRLRRKKRELEAIDTQCDLLSEKIKRLRASHAIEASVAVRFQLEQEIEQAETERRDVERQIDSLEDEIEALESKLGQLLSKSAKLLSSKRFWFVVGIVIAMVVIRVALNVVVRLPSPFTMPPIILDTESGDEIIKFALGEVLFRAGVRFAIVIVLLCICMIAFSTIAFSLYVLDRIRNSRFR